MDLVDHAAKHRLCSTTPVHSEKVRHSLLQHDMGSSSPARLSGMVEDLSKCCLSDDTVGSKYGSASDSGFCPEGKVSSTSFIVHDSTSAMDDPFTSTTSSDKDKSSKSSCDSAFTAPLVRGVSSASGDAGAIQAESTSSPFSPREDRIGQQPSADNAQALYPPDACVFVAKSVL